jgi:hypothetical protein
MVLGCQESLNYVCSTEGTKVSAIKPYPPHEVLFHCDEGLAGLSGTVSESPGMLSPLRQSATHSSPKSTLHRTQTRFVVLPSSTYLFTAGVEDFILHLITLKHTQHSVGLLWTRDRPVAETSTWQHKNCTRQTSMPPVGFEATIPASARPQTYALDCAATGISPNTDIGINFSEMLKLKLNIFISTFVQMCCKNILTPTYLSLHVHPFVCLYLKDVSDGFRSNSVS